MSGKREVVVVSGTRTPIGSFGGTLKDFSASKLGALVVKEAIARAKLDASQVEQLVCGNVIHGEARDMYVSRVVAIEAGMAQHSCGARAARQPPSWARCCGAAPTQPTP